MFPLNTVLYPGLVLPLHVFEERYRTLVAELMELPADSARRFGIVALRSGREVAPSGPSEEHIGTEFPPEWGVALSATGTGSGALAGLGPDPDAALYPVGCIAEIASMQQNDDESGYELVTSGTSRFRLLSVDTSGPYLTGEVEELPEEAGSGADAMVPGVTAAFQQYQKRLASARERTVTSDQEMPDDPKVLSYLVAAASVLDIHEKQELLAIDSAAERLDTELRMLRRESSLINEVPSLPAVELPQRTLHLN